VSDWVCTRRGRVVYDKEPKPFRLRDVHRIAMRVEIETQADALFSLAALGALAEDQLRYELQQSAEALVQIFSGQLGVVVSLLTDVMQILRLIARDQFTGALKIAFQAVPEVEVPSIVEV